MQPSDLDQHGEVFLNAARALRAFATQSKDFTYRDLTTMAVVCALVGQAYKDEARKLHDKG
jgi:hypothetical protein